MTAAPGSMTINRRAGNSAGVDGQQHRARRGRRVRLPDMNAPLRRPATQPGQPRLGEAHQAVMLSVMPMSTSKVRSASVKSRLGVAAPRSVVKETRSSAATSERSKWMPRAEHSAR